MWADLGDMPPKDSLVFERMGASRTARIPSLKVMTQDMFSVGMELELQCPTRESVEYRGCARDK